LIYLSIIIPVYNVEDYLKKCLLSILDSGADTSSYEVIAINDGSKDSSLDILHHYETLYDNLTVISQPNAGLGATRNKGASLAKGEYIWFVDSDDWITPSAIQSITELANAKKPDVININFEHSTGEMNPVINNAIPGIINSGVNYLLMSNIQNPAQYYIINSNFYRESKLSFEEKIYHEDSLFTPIALSLAKKVIFLQKVCYIYNIRENSIMTAGGNDYKHANDMLTVALKLMSFIKDERIDENGKYAITKYIAIGVGAIHYYSKKVSFKKKIELSNSLPLIKLFFVLLKSNKYKYIVSLLAIKLAMF
jgi:glycosyltransferase involved in cell wall biosynthesis